MENINTPLLEADALTKAYEPDVLALDQVSFKIYTGQIYAMLGANGAGKSTTINIFLNFIEPTNGRALVDGIETHVNPLRAREKLAYVSENVMLYPNFSAIQNLEYFSKLGGHDYYTKSDYHEALERVGLEKSSHNRKLGDYSKGMRQKCGIAIAILKNAPAIVLDEPTSGLDPKAGHDFTDLLLELKDEGKAILISTHDIFRAKQMADMVGIMSKGKIVTEQSKKELQQQDLEQLYLQYILKENNQVQEN